MGYGMITEDSVARRFAEIYADTLMYTAYEGDNHWWIKFEGDEEFTKDNSGLVFHLVRELVREMSEGELAETRIRVRTASFVGGVERLARNDPAFTKMTVRPAVRRAVAV